MVNVNKICCPMAVSEMQESMYRDQQEVSGAKGSPMLTASKGTEFC